MSALDGDDELPGGDGFVDARWIIDEASGYMHPGSYLAVEKFTLSDAMTAIEVMDPRMDSGMSASGQIKPLFDPLTPLLPAEVCWILDRSFACEMSWHSGNALSQTVFTLLYTHEVAHMRTDWFYRLTSSGTNAHERPIQLVTEVLRSSVYALLKSCDLVWTELMRGSVHEMEDFNGEKSEVSLCEGTPLTTVIDMLESSKKWLMSRQASHLSWRPQILQRLELRKHILMALSSPLATAPGKVKSHLVNARSLLHAIRNSPPPPQPGPNSPALAAFDPAINSRLVCVMPLKVIDLLPQHEAWDAIEGLLDGLSEACTLSLCESPLSWQSVLRARARVEPTPRRSAFVRSITLALFSVENTILSRHPPIWLFDAVFQQIAQVPAGTLLLEGPRPGAPLVVQIGVYPNISLSDVASVLERTITRLLIHYFTSFLHNRPRQRRLLSNNLVEWHIVVSQAQRLSQATMNLTEGVNSEKRASLHRLSLAVQYLRLVCVLEVVLSGLELDLYTSDEQTFTYWYAEQCLGQKSRILSELLDLLPDGSTAAPYLSSERDLADGLRSSCLAILAIITTSPPSKHSTQNRERTNIERRFKWAFEPEYSHPPDPTRPDVEEYQRQIKALRSQPEELNRHIAKGHFMRVQGQLGMISGRSAQDLHVTLCEPEYREFVRKLVESAEWNLEVMNSIVRPERVGASLMLQWEGRRHPWVPLLAHQP